MKIDYKKVPEKFIEHLKEICELLNYEIYRIDHWEEGGYSEVLVFSEKSRLKDIPIFDSERWKGSKKWELQIISQIENELINLPKTTKDRIKSFISPEIDYPSEFRCSARFYNSLENIKISTITEIPRALVYPRRDLLKILERPSTKMEKLINVLQKYDNQFEIKFKRLDERFIEIKEGVEGHWLTKSIFLLK